MNYIAIIAIIFCIIAFGSKRKLVYMELEGQKNIIYKQIKCEEEFEILKGKSEWIVKVSKKSRKQVEQHISIYIYNAVLTTKNKCVFLASYVLKKEKLSFFKQALLEIKTGMLNFFVVLKKEAKDGAVFLPSRYYEAELTKEELCQKLKNENNKIIPFNKLIALLLLSLSSGYIFSTFIYALIKIISKQITISYIITIIIYFCYKYVVKTIYLPSGKYKWAFRQLSLIGLIVYVFYEAIKYLKIAIICKK